METTTIKKPEHAEVKKEIKEKEEIKHTEKEQKKTVEEKKEHKTETKKHHVSREEKIYTIPLRKALRKSIKKRAPYCMKIIREFLITHTKTENVMIGKHLNEAVWKRGRQKPPKRVRVKVIKEDNIIKAELIGHDYVEFIAKKKEAKTKGLMDKMRRRMTPKEMQKQAEEDLIEGRKEEKPKAETEKLKEE
jgi:large subunit ribosomal protein L31e